MRSSEAITDDFQLKGPLLVYFGNEWTEEGLICIHECLITICVHSRVSFWKVFYHHWMMIRKWLKRLRATIFPALLHTLFSAIIRPSMTHPSFGFGCCQTKSYSHVCSKENQSTEWSKNTPPTLLGSPALDYFDHQIHSVWKSPKITHYNSPNFSSYYSIFNAEYASKWDLSSMIFKHCEITGIWIEKFQIWEIFFKIQNSNRAKSSLVP